MAATIATVAATAGANETATAAPTAAETGAAAAGATTTGLTTAFEALVLVGRAQGWAECKGVGRACVPRACARGASMRVSVGRACV